MLEPWPLKIVFDNVIGSKKMPAILASLVSNTTGDNKLAILEFAVLGVIAIAVTGCNRLVHPEIPDYQSRAAGDARPAAHSLHS